MMHHFKPNYFQRFFFFQKRKVSKEKSLSLSKTQSSSLNPTQTLSLSATQSLSLSATQYSSSEDLITIKSVVDAAKYEDNNILSEFYTKHSKNEDSRISLSSRSI